MIKSYPDHITGYANNYLLFKDGTKLLFNDFIPKDHIALLNNPSIADQFVYPYTKGTLITPPACYHDPGRINNEAFFKKIYGNSENNVKKFLKKVTWCPKLSGTTMYVTTINGIDKKIALISKEIDQHPVLKPYVQQPIGGSFKWRVIAGTKRLSLNSYGIAIDINTKIANYWRWDITINYKEMKNTMSLLY